MSIYLMLIAGCMYWSFFSNACSMAGIIPAIDDVDVVRFDNSTTAVMFSEEVRPELMLLFIPCASTWPNNTANITTKTMFGLQFWQMETQAIFVGVFFITL